MISWRSAARPKNPFELGALVRRKSDGLPDTWRAVRILEEQRPFRDPGSVQRRGEHVAQRDVDVCVERQRAGDAAQEHELCGLMGILLRHPRADGELPFELLDDLRRVLQPDLFAELRGRRRRPRTERFEQGLGRECELGRARNQRARADVPGQVAIGLRPIERRHQHDGDRAERRIGAQLLTELKPVDVGHEHVTQNDVRTRTGRQRERLPGARRRRHVEPEMGELNPGQLQLHRGVVDDQQPPPFTDDERTGRAHEEGRGVSTRGGGRPGSA